MATQLRPSRITRGAPGPAGKIQQVVNAKEMLSMVKSKPFTFQFLAMLLVAGVLDIFSFFLSEFGVGFIFSILGLIIFVPWFYLTGVVQMDIKKLTSMGSTTILELFPITGNLPCITLNVFYSYYSN